MKYPTTEAHETGYKAYEALKAEIKVLKTELELARSDVNDQLKLATKALREERKATLEEVLVAIRKSPGCDIMAGSDCVCCKVADTVRALLPNAGEEIVKVPTNELLTTTKISNNAPNGGKEVE